MDFGGASKYVIRPIFLVAFDHRIDVLRASPGLSRELSVMTARREQPAIVGYTPEFSAPLRRPSAGYRRCVLFTIACLPDDDRELAARLGRCASRALTPVPRRNSWCSLVNSRAATIGRLPNNCWASPQRLPEFDAAPRRMRTCVSGLGRLPQATLIWRLTYSARTEHCERQPSESQTRSARSAERWRRGSDRRACPVR